MENKPEVFVIIPTNRTDFKQNILDNLFRQSFRGFKTILVENGDAIDQFSKGSFDIILQSEANVSKARNTALSYLKENHPDSFFVFFDDDDYYDNPYIDECLMYAHRADVIGKSNVYYTLKNGVPVFLECDGEFKYANYIHGPTIAGWTKSAEMFPHVEKWGEDADWINLMLANGKTIFSTSRNNFMGKRHPKQTWAESDKVLLEKYVKNVYSMVGNEISIRNCNVSLNKIEDISTLLKI